jgi:hypothetical protein
MLIVFAGMMRKWESSRSESFKSQIAPGDLVAGMTSDDFALRRQGMLISNDSARVDKPEPTPLVICPYTRILPFS